MLLFLTALLTFLTDNIMIFVCVSLTECAILSVITCQWAFLIAVSLSASDAVLPDIAINNIKNKQTFFQMFCK